MRYQPGEPNKHLKALSQYEFDNQTLLTYCSGNNLIIFLENQLVQTIYLPTDGIAVDINPKTADIVVCLQDQIQIFALIKSFSKGNSWKLKSSLNSLHLRDCKWIDSQLLIIGETLQLTTTNGETLWKQSIPDTEEVVVAPDSQSFVLLDGSPLLSVWSRVSSSACSFDFNYLRVPSKIHWCKWVDGLLFTWSEDCVLRAFGELKSRFELVVSVQLPLVSPILLESHVLYAYESKCTLIKFRSVGYCIRPEYIWRDIPIEFDNIHKKFNLYDSINIVATQTPTKINLTAHKHGELLTATIPALTTAAAAAPDTLHVTFTGIYTGHLKSIKRICRSSRGNALFTQTRFTENIVWGAYKLPNGETTLEKLSTVNVNNPDCADLWDRSLVTVSNNTLTLWDTSKPHATESTSLELPSTPMNICCLTYDNKLHAMAIYKDKIMTWQVKDTKLVSLKDSALDVDIDQATMVDPVGWTRPKDRDVLTTLSKGAIRTWSLSIEGQQPKWTETSILETKLQNVKMKMSSRKKLAVAHGNRLFIWDAVNDIVEFDKVANEDETVNNDLDWTTTPTGECLLGVGYSKRVVIYCQQRYDYTAKLEAWIPIRVLDISKQTEHEIGDSIWLKDGTFVIGAGNQLFIQDAQVDFEDQQVRDLLKERNTISSLEQSSTLFDINAVLNGPLPIYHPQFLIQLIFTGQVDVACDILGRLNQQIKYATVIEPHMIVVLDYWLGLDPNKELKPGTKFDEPTAAELENQLQKKALSYLTRHQQMTLLSVVQSLAHIQHSLDSSGTKFMLGFQLFRLHQKTQESMNMRDFVWGSISNSKQVLLDEVERAGALTSLNTFTQYGLMFWLENNALTEQTEQLAKRVFAKTRDPVQVSLLYLAMRKLPLLVGLWRISSSHPEQAKTMKLLSNDFSTDRWKSAALKNAYALMSKHRYEYAAALFLLGGACKDAVNILARQLKNLPLAFMVARLYDGDDGEAVKYLIDRFLSDDDESSDDIYSHKHWLRVWAYMTVGDTKNAVKSATVIRDTRAKRSIVDPVLVWMYNELRSKSSLGPKDEMKVLKRTAAIYCRMGCDLIALRMGSKWEFTREPVGVTPAVSVMPSKATTPEPVTPQLKMPEPVPKMPEPVAAPQAAQFDLSAFGF